MKHNIFIGAAAIVILSLFLCSCASKSTSPPDLSGRLVCDVTVKYDQNELSLSLDRTSIGVYTLSVISPEAINGMIFKYSDGQVTVSFRGTERRFEGGSLPESSVIETLVSLTDAASSAEALEYIGDRDGLAVFSGSFDNRAFELFSDGELRRIELCDQSFCAEFTPAEK